MVCCAAYNCSNSSKLGYKLYVFPAEKNRRKKWVINCRRGGGWQPTVGSRLCEIHFEACQWETKREDGWRKLKPNAVPTLFDVPNPPPKFSSERSRRKTEGENGTSEIGPRSTKPTNSCVPATDPCDVANFASGEKSLQEQIDELKAENAQLRKDSENYKSKLTIVLDSLKRHNDEEEIRTRENERKLEQLNSSLKDFLNDDQIQFMGQDKIKRWSPESIMKGLKLRFILGVHGYNYLCQTNYPIPSYSTLNRRIQKYKVSVGILSSILEPLRHKIECMDPEDRYCALSMDEMQINAMEDFVKNQRQFNGFVTLGDTSQLGTHLLVVLLRGVKNPWKQVVACHVTNATTGALNLKQLILDTISFVEDCGLRVVSLTSDMGGKNVSVWSSLNVVAKKDGTRCNYFIANGHDVYVIPDTCHLLKNLKNSVLKGPITLPPDVVRLENLPTNVVRGRYVEELWRAEVDEDKAFRSLHHLKIEDINPSNFDKMNVAPAVRFFSDDTAAALELGVHYKILEQDALTTAWFIRFVSEWFKLVTSRVRKKSVTKWNATEKSDFLRKCITIFQEIRLDPSGNWKPLNTGMVLANLSLLDICNFLIEGVRYDFVLLSRFTQDALENVFSQIRRRGGATPSISKCLQALRIVTLSQFISDVRKSNYSNDSDIFLLNHFKNDSDPSGSQISNLPVRNLREIKTPNFERQFVTEEVNEHFSSEKYGLTDYDLNLIYYLAGSATNYCLKRNLCLQCETFLKGDPITSVLPKFNVYLHLKDHGGLKVPCKSIFQLYLNCHIIYDQYHDYILRNNSALLIRKIINDIEFDYSCQCPLKKYIVDHYFCLRSFSVVHLGLAKRKKSSMYGTSAPKRKKVVK